MEQHSLSCLRKWVTAVACDVLGRGLGLRAGYVVDGTGCWGAWHAGVLHACLGWALCAHLMQMWGRLCVYVCVHVHGCVLAACVWHGDAADGHHASHATHHTCAALVVQVHKDSPDQAPGGRFSQADWLLALITIANRMYPFLTPQQASDKCACMWGWAGRFHGSP